MGQHRKFVRACVALFVTAFLDCSRAAFAQAIVITIITPFTKTLDDNDGLINSIGAIFFTDMVTTNVIQLLDPVGHLKRHLFAPRAKTQDHMNLLMQGEEIELAERYTNMTKIFFLTLWYCSIYPGTFFMCSFALLINFFVDRFSLMVRQTFDVSMMLSVTLHRSPVDFRLFSMTRSERGSAHPHWALPSQNLVADTSYRWPLWQWP